MNYPNVAEQDAPQPIPVPQEIPEVYRPTPEQPMPQQPVIVQQSVPPARPKYGGSSWAKPRQFDFQTPSGSWCRLQKVSQEDAITMGLLNHIDIFSPKLLRDAAGNKRKSEDIESDVVKKLADEKQGDDFFATIKRIVMSAVVEPRLVDEPKDADLPEGVYSINNVGFQDKMAIFHAVFGEDMQKIESFRDGQEVGVGAVQPEQVRAPAPEQNPGNT